MTNHAGFGRLMMALPNGRKAEENFTSGITPVSSVAHSLAQALHLCGKTAIQVPVQWCGLEPEVHLGHWR